VVKLLVEIINLLAEVLRIVVASILSGKRGSASARAADWLSPSSSCSWACTCAARMIVDQVDRFIR
jgi:hypothetical protein